MKKLLKTLTSLVMAVAILVSTMEVASAATFTWTATKNPGTSIGVDTVEIPLYKGTMTFKVTNLTGSCSYLLGKCVSNSSLYYINNTAKSVMITKVNGTQTFSMKFTTAGLKEDYMYLKCTVEHNASIGELVSASGKIYY